jgi:uncharacterized protein HemX
VLARTLSARALPPLRAAPWEAARLRARDRLSPQAWRKGAMSSKHLHRTVVTAALLLAAAGSACVQEKVEMKKRELAHIKKDLTKAQESLKAGVQETTEIAKEGVAKLNEKLPELKETAKEGLSTAKEGLLETRDKVVETVKGTLEQAREEVDQ